MSRKIKFSIGEYYHVYNRGVDKRDIFIDRHDYDRFLLLLSVCNSSNPINIREIKRTNYKGPAFVSPILVNVGAWCLMPNHFHFLVKEEFEGGMSAFFHKLSTAYSMYFNKKYGRSGSLFEGKFKSQHAETDRHLKYLFSYIHLNPIKLIQKDWKEKGVRNKKEAINYLEKYPYSSYLDFIGKKRVQNKILTIEAFPKYFPGVDYFVREIFEWIVLGMR